MKFSTSKPFSGWCLLVSISMVHLPIPENVRRGKPMEFSRLKFWKRSLLGSDDLHIPGHRWIQSARVLPATGFLFPMLMQDVHQPLATAMKPRELTMIFRIKHCGIWNLNSPKHSKTMKRTYCWYLLMLCCVRFFASQDPRIGSSSLTKHSIPFKISASNSAEASSGNFRRSWWHEQTSRRTAQDTPTCLERWNGCLAK